MHPSGSVTADGMAGPAGKRLGAGLFLNTGNVFRSASIITLERKYNFSRSFFHKPFSVPVV